tara:strand:- start:619299 stop:620432 length:1134 start_codon:yes stop_codon:yes gene_type:complete
VKKILIVFGTRPEAIKMAPVVKVFKENATNFNTKVCVTAQHREMLDQVLDFFSIKPDFDLDLMKPNQNLHKLTADIIVETKIVLDAFKPDFVFVHGDTTTSMAVALAAFYNNVKVCHVEAGLRTHNKYSPFPEEINRQLTGRIADYHFAPTERSKQNLIDENVNESTIFVTGNTVIDALLMGKEIISNTAFDSIKKLNNLVDLNRDFILVTGHRRENHGAGFENIIYALKNIAKKYPEIDIIYPVHLNPKVKKPVEEALGNIDNIKLIEPQPYEAFIWLMDNCKFIITDSGGVQEEAPSLGKPVLVMRDTTERPEAVEAGTVILVGANADTIESNTMKLLENSIEFEKMSLVKNPYGDGSAAKKILEFIKLNIDNKY